MRLDETGTDGRWVRSEVVVEKITAAWGAAGGRALSWGVNVFSVLVSEWSTRREAERHAARIRRALKGER